MRAKSCFIIATIAASLFGTTLPIDAAETTPSTDEGTIAASARQQIAKIVPGQSTMSDVQTMLGAPWRVVQFNDCGMAMDDQADEIWEYRGADPGGGYRLHVEFSDNGVVHLVAKIPDGVPGGKAVAAKIAPDEPHRGTQM
jgi:hypothetical protein